MSNFKVTMQSDRVSMPAPVDAFMQTGWRRLVLKMFEVSLRDLIGKDDELAQAAYDWFDPVKGRNAAIKFEDCVYAMGMASRIDAVRAKALNQPEQMLREVESVTNSMALSDTPRQSASAEIAPIGLQVDNETASQIQRAMFGHA